MKCTVTITATYDTIDLDLFNEYSESRLDYPLTVESFVEFCIDRVAGSIDPASTVEYSVSNGSWAITDCVL